SYVDNTNHHNNINHDNNTNHDNNINHGDININDSLCVEYNSEYKKEYNIEHNADYFELNNLTYNEHILSEKDMDNYEKLPNRHIEEEIHIYTHNIKNKKKSILNKIHFDNNIYKKLEYVNKLKTLKKWKIEKDYYYNGLKIKKEKFTRISKFVEECMRLEKPQDDPFFTSPYKENIYIENKYLMDSFIFDNIYKKVLYISDKKRYRTLTIKHIYKEYINYFLPRYKSLLIDYENYKFCYNFSFDLLFYILFYCFKRLHIYCLPHHIKNYINSDNFGLYKIFYNISESFFKQFKDNGVISFPLRNPHFSEIKKFYFIRNLKHGTPFICIHNYEHINKYYIEEKMDKIYDDEDDNYNDENNDNYNDNYNDIYNDNNNIYGEVRKKDILYEVKFSRKIKHVPFTIKTINSMLNKESMKYLENFNATLVNNLYGLINDLIYKFHLPITIQMYAIKFLNVVLFKYRFSKFLLNVYTNKYDDMHIEFNNFYNYEKVYKDCFKCFGAKYKA
ncbi:hypothetical protein PFBG_06004, partial [Plasmodium falciparum 7G8]